MKKSIVILAFLPLSFFSQEDSLSKTHFNISAGISVSAIWKQGLQSSAQPIGYRFGIGLTKAINSKYELAANVWYQHSAFYGIKTTIWDGYFSEQVDMNTDIEFKQLYMSGELTRRIKRFNVGFNGGISYLIKSYTQQAVTTTATYPTSVNIENKYMVYAYQYDSFYSTINPFLGLTISYFPLNWLGIKIQNNTDVFAAPYKKYQYFTKFRPCLNSLTLTIKIK